MSQSHPPPYSILGVSQLVNVTVFIEKDGNPTVNLGNFSLPLRFDAIVERLIQLGKCRNNDRWYAFVNRKGPIKDTPSPPLLFRTLGGHRIQSPLRMALRANFLMDRGKLTCSHLLPYFRLYDLGNNDCMDRDQPLIHFYHKIFVPIHDGKAEEPPPYVNEARLTHGGQMARVNGVKIRFHRCVGRFLRVNIFSLS